MEIFEKVRCQGFQNNIFENKAGIYLAVIITQLLQKYPTVLKIL